MVNKTNSIAREVKTKDWEGTTGMSGARLTKFLEGVGQLDAVTFISN